MKNAIEATQRFAYDQLGENMKTSDMWLVYADNNGNKHYQHYLELAVGTLIDPETDDDMEVIGWTQEKPKC